MANGEFDIDESTFKEMNSDSQMWMLFTTFNSHRIHCDERFCKLEKRKKLDTTLGAISGFFGGLAGFIGSKILKIP